MGAVVPDNITDEREILAAHGQWICELKESLEGIAQRLTLLERNVSTWESQLVKIGKVQRDLDSKADSMSAEMKRLKNEINSSEDGEI